MDIKDCKVGQRVSGEFYTGTITAVGESLVPRGDRGDSMSYWALQFFSLLSPGWDMHRIDVLPDGRYMVHAGPWVAVVSSWEAAANLLERLGGMGGQEEAA